MLIRRLRSNHPAALVLLPLFGVILWLPAWLQPQEYPADVVYMPLMNFLVDLFSGFPLFRAILAFILVLLQSYLFKRLLERRNIFTEYSNLPAYLFFVFSSLFYQQLQLSPVLVANTLLLLALNRSMSIHNQISVKRQVFDSAFYISLASLIYQPIVFLFPVIWIALIIIRSFAWRDWVISLIGLVLPYAYAWTYYFLVDKTIVFKEMLFEKTHYFPQFEFSPDNIITISIAGLIVLNGLFFVIKNLPTQTVRVRHLLSILLWFMVFNSGSLYFSGFDYMATYSILAIPFTVFINNRISTFRKNWLANFWLWALLLALLVNHYWQWLELLI